MSDDLFSRAQLAGYDPACLHRARVAVVGLGALGQNALQDLALSGIGNFVVIDDDSFEPHNATRSPFYPTPSEQRRLGLAKAPNVAHRLLQISTAPHVEIYFESNVIEAIGDGLIRWADVVVSAVDNVRARCWLAERARIHGKPMVEAGFSGPRFNLACFSGHEGDVCYRCSAPPRESSASCTQYALAAEAASIIPAIQTTAAVLGGYQAEQVIRILHDKAEQYGLQVYGNIRRCDLQTAELPLNPDCRGQHAPLPLMATVEVGAGASLGELARVVGQDVGSGWLMLSEPAICYQNCTKCRTMCEVLATETAWLRKPLCTVCGGRWPRCARQSPSAYQILNLSDPNDGWDSALGSLGLLPGSTVIHQQAPGLAGLIAIAGNTIDVMQRAGTDPR